MAAVEKLKKAKDGDDLNALKSGLRRAGASGPRDGDDAGQRSARRCRPGPQGGQAPPTGKKDGDDVVDAEFEVK